MGASMPCLHPSPPPIGRCAPSHFILAGLSIPVTRWKDCDREIAVVKKKYALESAEIHIAWMLRPYLEQTRIPGFDSLDYRQRRSQVDSLRKAELLRLQRVNLKQYQQTRKNYRLTQSYIHLTLAERRRLAKDLAQCICNWGFARLFAECIDKVHFDPARTSRTVDEQAFEQVVSRFEQFLQNIGTNSPLPTFGLLIHDNNETVAKKHTELMTRFFRAGTLWTDVKNIIETPLFVDSQLTSMVQLADVYAYALPVPGEQRGRTV